jgi:hypothetical protein
MRHLRPLCSHCVYWLADNTANPPTVGHCHRFPPGVVISPQGTVVQKFPSTDHRHWCGEWSDDAARLIEAAKRIAVSRALE